MSGDSADSLSSILAQRARNHRSVMPEVRGHSGIHPRRGDKACSRCLGAGRTLLRERNRGRARNQKSGSCRRRSAWRRTVRHSYTWRTASSRTAAWRTRRWSYRSRRSVRTHTRQGRRHIRQRRATAPSVLHENINLPRQGQLRGVREPTAMRLSRRGELRRRAPRVRCCAVGSAAHPERQHGMRRNR